MNKQLKFLFQSASFIILAQGPRNPRDDPRQTNETSNNLQIKLWSNETSGGDGIGHFRLSIS